MKTSTFGVSVIVCASLFAIGTASAQSGSGGGSVGSGMTSQGLASEPAGIGEKGTGQTQSTLERSGVPAQKGNSEQAGQTQGKSMEEAGSPMSSGIGEKGTGQTQSTVERSGGQGSSQTQPSHSQSAMEQPEK
jgi:hypothetical protein